MEEKSKGEILREILKKEENASKYGYYHQYDYTFLPRRNAAEQPKLEALPNGVYEAKIVGMNRQITFSEIKIQSDELLQLNDSPGNALIKDIRTFFKGKAKEKLKKKGLAYKRGGMLAGPPGTGKTSILGLITKDLQDEAVILFNPDVYNTLEFLRCIQEIEPNKSVIVIWEEFDSFLGGSRESELLSLLDGQVSVENVYFLATTNYLSRIPSRFKFRPSRFANVIIVDKPSKADRKLYLESKLTEPEEQYLIPILLNQSKGFVIDQLKDLIVSVTCFDIPVNEAVRKIKEMAKDSMGVDDFNEENTKTIFKSNIDNKNLTVAEEDED
jgi:hypothetical protein